MILQGIKKCDISLRLSTSLVFEQPSFRNEALTYGAPNYRFGLFDCLITWHPMYYKRSSSKGQRSRSQRNIRYQQWKRYKSGTDRLYDFSLGMGVSTKAENDWHDIGRPQVAMHRDCHIFYFLWVFVFLNIYIFNFHMLWLLLQTVQVVLSLVILSRRKY